MHFRNATVNAIFDHGHNSFTLNWLQWMPSRSRNTTTPKYWGHYYFSYCLFLLLFLLTTPALAFPTDNHPPQTLAWVAFSVFVYASFEISMNCRCNRPGHGSCLRLMCYMCAGGPYPYLKPPYPWVMVHEPNRPQKSVECISLAVHLVSSRRRQSWRFSSSSVFVATRLGVHQAMQIENPDPSPISNCYPVFWVDTWESPRSSKEDESRRRERNVQLAPLGWQRD